MNPPIQSPQDTKDLGSTVNSGGQILGHDPAAKAAENKTRLSVVKPPRDSDKLTVAEICQELDIARSTFYDWRAKGRAPRCIRLPNGEIRIRRSELERWLDTCEEAA